MADSKIPKQFVLSTQDIFLEFLEILLNADEFLESTKEDLSKLRNRIAFPHEWQSFPESCNEVFICKQCGHNDYTAPPWCTGA